MLESEVSGLSFVRADTFCTITIFLVDLQNGRGVSVKQNIRKILLFLFPGTWKRYYKLLESDIRPVFWSFHKSRSWETRAFTWNTNKNAFFFQNRKPEWNRGCFHAISTNELSVRNSGGIKEPDLVVS